MAIFPEPSKRMPIRDSFKILAGPAALLLAVGCASAPVTMDGAPTANVAVAEANPLLTEWAGPYGGVPPFDRGGVEDFEPALEAAMAENLAEVEAIADNPAPATFDNTIAALERAGER
jgi:peptidyl-dipeptidase Dcp